MRALADTNCTGPEYRDFVVCFPECKACRSEKLCRQWTARGRVGVVGSFRAACGRGDVESAGTITHVPDHDCW